MKELKHVTITIDPSNTHFGRDYAIVGVALLVMLAFGVYLWRRFR